MKKFAIRAALAALVGCCALSDAGACWRSKRKADSATATASPCVTNSPAPSGQVIFRPVGSVGVHQVGRHTDGTPAFRVVETPVCENGRCNILPAGFAPRR